MFLSATALSAQQPATQSSVTQDLRAARQLLTDRKLDEATAAFQAAIDAAHRLGLEAEEAEGHCGLGETLVHRTKYGDAEVVLNQCLEAAERRHDLAGVGRALVSLSQAADLTGRYAEALTLAKRAVSSYDAIEDRHGRSLARLQVMRIRSVPLDEQKVLADAIIADARVLNDPILEADALHSIADQYFVQDHFEEAFDALTRARDLYHQGGAFGDEGTVLNSLGRVYRAHGRLDEALSCQLYALALHEKYGTPFELMQSHNAVAVVLNTIGEITAARDQYDRALAIARQSSSPRIQDFLDANVAGLLIDEGEYERAARILEQILSHGIDAYPSTRYSYLSEAYRRLNRPADAFAAADRALATCEDDELQCLMAIDSRASASAALGDNSAALADLRTALTRIEALRARLVPSDFLKQNFHEAQGDVYSRSISIAVSQHEDRQSLETAELASSRAFLDLLAARGEAGVAAPAPRGAVGSGDLASHAIAVPAKADDLAGIAERLHSTLVVYWPADGGLFVWVVKSDGQIASRRVDVSKARLLQLIRATASAPQDASVVAHRPWRQLYETLVAPIRDQLPRANGSLLTIIPHGVLMNVSFAALQAPNGRYLLEDYAIHYAPAGAVLQFTAELRRPDARRGAALLVADPSFASRAPLDRPLPALPGSREEVSRIAALLPAARVTSLQGRSATEPRVIAASANKTILHFATHAIVRDDQPNDSYLAFAPGGGAPDGLLSARDVYELRLNADLVVLSACRSGGGRVTGDGIATFARAFIYAGTPSLIVSLWDVADEPTNRLLPAFYRSWLAGASKARSLRRAQLQLLAELRAHNVRIDTKAGPVVLPEHPMFWAGFVLIGEPD